MLSLLLNRPLSVPCQYFSDVVVVRYLLLLVLRLSVVCTILNVSGVCSVGFPTVGASWFNATSTALVSPLGDLRSAIAVEHNVVCFFDIVQFT